MSDKGRVLILTQDLIFGVRLADAARSLGFAPVDVDLRVLQDRIDDRTALIVLDAGYQGDWQSTIRGLKRDARTARIPVLAYGSHVNVMTSRAAVEAGCDRFVTRGKLMAELAQLLQTTARQI
jgi:DNA-binding response OmpR family regulator